MDTGTAAIGLRYEARVTLCRAERSHLAWLREFLTPWFEELREGDAHAATSGARVELLLDDAAFERCRNAGPDPGGAAIDAFALDAGMLRLPLYRSAERGARVAFDEQLGVFYCAESPDGAPSLRVTGASGNLRARVALMRVVRELAQGEARAAGHALLHAAAIGTANGGALIAGAKRAGKTTLLVHALRAGAELVSNDRALLVGRPDGVAARGLPTIVRIRDATLAGLPESLRAPLASGRIDHLDSRDEIGLSAARPRHGRPRNLSPAQLCDWLGAPARREAPLDRVLLLRTGESPDITARELSPDAAVERLLGCAFGDSRVSALFAPRTAPAPHHGDLLRSCRTLAKSARCHDVELGIGTGGAEISDVLGALLG